jgi:hypothetical protein
MPRQSTYANDFLIVITEFLTLAKTIKYDESFQNYFKLGLVELKTEDRPRPTYTV